MQLKTQPRTIEFIHMSNSNSPQIVNQKPLDTSFNWKIGGKAGEGVMTTAKTLARACQRHGFEVFNYYEYPSLIKGGHQTGQVYADSQQATCQKRKLDLLIALDENSIKLHLSEIGPGTIVIAEPSIDKYSFESYEKTGATFIEVPLTNIAREKTGTSIAANTVALGVSAYFLNLNSQIFLDLLKEEFAGKGDEVVSKNQAAFNAGFEAAQKLGQPTKKTTKTNSNTILLTGNEAVGLGAIAAGIQYYAAYPMTPASALLHFLAAQQDKYPLIVKHTEDEISAINQALGASFAGVRAMTGTSGGGFALMVEGLSLAGMTELPLVILYAMRPGPATGLPTWTSQADLQFVLRAGHGEFQRIVLTPGSVQEHFELTQKAFYLAEKYHIPVFILSDKYILESHQTMPTPNSIFENQRYGLANEDDLLRDNSYLRYKINTPNSVSPRSLPGQPHGLYVANSYEHDEFGFATEEIDMTVKQVNKRALKIAEIKNEIPQPYIIGPENADVTFVSWGSTINVLHELIRHPTTNYQLPTTNSIHFPCVWPFPKNSFESLAKKAHKLIIIEGNHDGQLEQLISQETDIKFEHRLRKFDGRPFYAEDILEFISSL